MARRVVKQRTLSGGGTGDGGGDASLVTQPGEEPSLRPQSEVGLWQRRRLAGRRSILRVEVALGVKM